MRKGQKATNETKQRMSEAAKHRVINWTPEMRKRRSEIAIKSNTGRILSNETKQRISKALKGKKQSKETRRKKSIAHKGLGVGIKNNNWKGGISNHPPDLSEELRLEIKKRDNFQCQDENCKGRSNNLDMHHIDKNKWNNSFNNLTTLCRSCHKILHTK